MLKLIVNKLFPITVTVPQVGRLPLYFKNNNILVNTLNNIDKLYII